MKVPNRAVPGVQPPLDEWRPKTQLELKDRALAVAAEGVTIADATLPDMPLIYANAGFERLTGYAVDEVLGRNCRFLQGPETDQDAVEEIRRAIREERQCLVEILNYRKNGTKFWNRLSITPVRNSDGELTHFIGVQSDVSERRQAEEQLRCVNRTLQEINDRMRGDLEAAARIQQSLLPRELPAVAGLRFAWHFDPCDELAGDTLNIVPLDEDRLGLYVIDVSGHGVRSALLSVTLSHTLSSVKSRSALFSADAGPDGEHQPVSPCLVAERLNRQFQMQQGRTQYFTMIYGQLSCSDRRFRYVSAGHPPAIYLPRCGEPVELAATGLPIGVLDEAQHEEQELTLEIGDRLYLYTDGIIEASPSGTRAEEFGVERLRELLVEARAVSLDDSLARVREAVRTWCGDRNPDDDLSLLAIEASDR